MGVFFGWFFVLFFSLFELWFLAYCFFTVLVCNWIWCIATVIRISGSALYCLAWDPVCRVLRYFSLIWCHQTGTLHLVVTAAQLICSHYVILLTQQKDLYRKKLLLCWARGVCRASRKRAVCSPAGSVSFFDIWKCSLPPQDFMSIIEAVWCEPCSLLKA